jgi:hypothetical protein
MGFDHGVGHPLLLCDAKASNCLQNKFFNDLVYYFEWPKAADAMIEATGQRKQKNNMSPVVIALLFVLARGVL